MNKRLSHHINTKKWILQGICKNNTKMNTDATCIVAKNGCVNFTINVLAKHGFIV